MHYLFQLLGLSLTGLAAMAGVHAWQQVMPGRIDSSLREALALLGCLAISAMIGCLFFVPGQIYLIPAA